MVEAARAAELQPHLAQGQRLVSPDGGLWRWDGLVGSPTRRTARPPACGSRAACVSSTPSSSKAAVKLELSREETERARRARSKTTAELERCEVARETARAALAEARTDKWSSARAAAGALAAELASLPDSRATIDAEMAELTEVIGSLAVQLEGAASRPRIRLFCAATSPMPKPGMPRRSTSTGAPRTLRPRLGAPRAQPASVWTLPGPRPIAGAPQRRRRRPMSREESWSGCSSRRESPRARADLGALEQRVSVSRADESEVEVEWLGREGASSRRRRCWRRAGSITPKPAPSTPGCATASSPRPADWRRSIRRSGFRAGRAANAQVRIAELSERRAALAGRQGELAEAAGRARDQQGRLEVEIAGAQARGPRP